ncbi:hypothetical protein L9F63_015775, partial [Diploptera punctata]
TENIWDTYCLSQLDYVIYNILAIELLLVFAYHFPAKNCGTNNPPVHGPDIKIPMPPTTLQKRLTP